jgi:hypothetical protein
MLLDFKELTQNQVSHKPSIHPEIGWRIDQLGEQTEKALQKCEAFTVCV